MSSQCVHKAVERLVSGPSLDELPPLEALVIPRHDLLGCELLEVFIGQGVGKVDIGRPRVRHLEPPEERVLHRVHAHGEKRALAHIVLARPPHHSLAFAAHALDGKHAPPCVALAVGIDRVGVVTTTIHAGRSDHDLPSTLRLILREQLGVQRRP